MDIVDRLITRVELQGGAGYVRGLASMGQETARLSAAQKKFIDLGARSVMAPGDKDLAAQAKAAKREFEGLEKQDNRTSLAMGTGAEFFLGAAVLTTAVAGISRLVEGLTQAQLDTEKLTRRFSVLFSGKSGAQQGFALASQFAGRYGRDLSDVLAAEQLLAEKGVKEVGLAMKWTAVLSDRSGKDMAQTADDVAKAWLGNRDALRQYGLSMNQLKQTAPQVIDGLTGATNRYQTALKELSFQAGGAGSRGAGALGFLMNLITLPIQIGTKDFEAFNVDRKVRAYGRARDTWDAASPEWRKAHPDFQRQLLALKTNIQGELARDEGRASALTNPNVANTAMGQVGLIRQWVGGGAIGGIGIKPSELPGINQRFGAAPSQIQIDGSRIDRAVKQSFNEWQEQLNRHGVAPPGPYH